MQPLTAAEVFAANHNKYILCTRCLAIVKSTPGGHVHDACAVFMNGAPVPIQGPAPNSLILVVKESERAAKLERRLRTEHIAIQALAAPGLAGHGAGAGGGGALWVGGGLGVGQGGGDAGVGAAAVGGGGGQQAAGQHGGGGGPEEAEGQPPVVNPPAAGAGVGGARAGGRRWARARGGSRWPRQWSR